MYFYCHIISLHFCNCIILPILSFFYPSTFFYKSLDRCSKLSSSFIFSIKMLLPLRRNTLASFPSFLIQRLYKKNHGSRNNFLAMISPFKYNFHSYGFFFCITTRWYRSFQKIQYHQRDSHSVVVFFRVISLALASSKYLNRSGD